MTTTGRAGPVARFWAVIIDNSLLLIGGTAIGLAWANVDGQSYTRTSSSAA